MRNCGLNVDCAGVSSELDAQMQEMVSFEFKRGSQRVKQLLEVPSLAFSPALSDGALTFLCAMCRTSTCYLRNSKRSTKKKPRSIEKSKRSTTPSTSCPNTRSRRSKKTRHTAAAFPMRQMVVRLFPADPLRNTSGNRSLHLSALGIGCDVKLSVEPHTLSSTPNPHAVMVRTSAIFSRKLLHRRTAQRNRR